MKVPECTSYDVSVDLSDPAILPSYRRQTTPAFEEPAYLPEPAEDPKNLEKPYDPHEHCAVDNPTSFWGTVFHTFILMAGPGVLSIPSTFVNAGYLIGVILMPVLFCLYVHNSNMFIWSEYQLCKLKRTPTFPYPQVAYQVFKEGPKFSRWLSTWSRRLAYADFVLVWYSYYCYSFVIVSQNLQIMFLNMFDADISINTSLQIVTVPILILSCIPKLKYLEPVSFIGMLCNGISLVLIVYFVITDHSPWQIPPLVGSLYNVPIFIGAVLLNMNISGILIPLKHEMKEPHRFSGPWLSVLNIAFMPTSILYTLFSLICALKYGHSMRPSVIENLPPRNPIAQIGMALSSISVICQQPLTLMVTYDIIWNQILKKRTHPDYHQVVEYVLRIVLVFLAFGISMALPNVFLFVSIGGTLGTSIDSLILPASIHTVMAWKLCKDKFKFWVTFVKNMVIILFAVVLAIIGCIDSIRQISEYYSNPS